MVPIGATLITRSEVIPHIIAGAGAAGCVLANRLLAFGKHTVLLLEAGGKDSSLWFKIPVGFAKMYYNLTLNWMYYSQPQKQLANRAIYASRGKVQGGSGSINAMIYVRGQAHDFDDWAADGNDTFMASKEVILCAGAVDTPKILQLSGVADQSLLKKTWHPAGQALGSRGPTSAGSSLRQLLLQGQYSDLE